MGGAVYQRVLGMYQQPCFQGIFMQYISKWTQRNRPQLRTVQCLSQPRHNVPFLGIPMHDKLHTGPRGLIISNRTPPPHDNLIPNKVRAHKDHNIEVTTACYRSPKGG
jgi:hypothetical protein